MSKSHSLTYQHHHPPCPVPDYEGYPNGNPRMVHSQPNLSNKRWADKGAARCPNIPHHDNHTIGIQNSSSLLNLFSCLTWESKASDQEMAQAMASMTSLRGASQAVLEGSLQLSGSNRLSVAGNTRVSVSRTGFTIRAQQQVSSETEAVVAQSSRRAVLGLVTAGLATGSFVKAVLADAVPIKVGPPPPPSGGLPGTKNSDEARDLEKPLKERFFIQPLTPAEAAARAKASAQEILGVKALIDKKAWPYVQNDLRLRAEYLRYDLNTVISSMPKDQKKTLKDLTGKLFQTLGNLDHAAKTKSSSEAEKYYAETVSTLNDVLAKIG